MAGIYEEVEIEDMKYDAVSMSYIYPCPCGDKFTITLEELHDGEDIATCPSCTLRVRIIFDADSLPSLASAQEQAAKLEAEGKSSEDSKEDAKDAKDSKDAK